MTPRANLTFALLPAELEAYSADCKALGMAKVVALFRAAWAEYMKAHPKEKP